MRVFLRGLAVLTVLWVGGVAAAPTPTPEQIEQFRKLPPEQQKALAAQYGVNLETVTTSGQTIKPLEQPVVVAPRATASADGVKALADGVISKGETGEEQRQRLKRFGYDLFAGEPNTFAPVTEIPIPAEYVIGPGDVLQVQLFGQRNESLNLQVNRDGRINFPGLGPITVAGMSFEAASEMLLKRISQQLIGVQASVTMGELRSMRVFVLGDAYRPGAYTVSSLSTMTNALFVSGGVREIGSLRTIQLKRNGRLISTLDLYDLLLKGDTARDVRLKPGDVIFIPPVGATAAISGEVRRPAIYELKAGETVDALIRMAGGLEPTAYGSVSVLERISGKKLRTVTDVNLSEPASLRLPLRDGDRLNVLAVSNRLDQNVEFVGAVIRPGKFEWRSGMRITDFLRSLRADLREDADLSYALVVRERNARGEIDILEFDLGRAIADGRSDQNLPLQPRDRVLVFSRPGNQVDAADRGEREQLMAPLLTQLQQQSHLGEPAAIVSVDGDVHLPSSYPLPVSGSVEDLLRAAGGLKASAYALSAEVARTDLSDPKEAKLYHLTLNLADKEVLHRFKLQPRDRLTVRRLPEWSEELRIELKGEVRHPGAYTFHRGEALAQVIARAGGLTAHAYAKGAVFTRKELQEQEQQRLKDLETRLMTELASAAASEANKNVAETAERQLQVARMLEQLRKTQAVGRMVIDLPAVVAQQADADIRLEDGDVLVIPHEKQSVTVLGEVQLPTSHFYRTPLSMNDYVERSGGLSARADDERVYVIRANGEVRQPKGLLWFNGDVRNMEPGDTVVAPLKVELVSSLDIWTKVTQIIYQSAVAVAAIGSL